MEEKDEEYRVVRPDFNAEIERLIAELAENPEKIDQLEGEKIAEMRKYMNPFGRVIAGKDSWTCLSITNFKEEYLRKFVATSLVGFLYRMCDEFGVESGEDRPPTRKVAEDSLLDYKKTTAVKEFHHYKAKYDKADAEFRESKAAYFAKLREFREHFREMVAKLSESYIRQFLRINPEDADFNIDDDENVSTEPRSIECDKGVVDFLNHDLMIDEISLTKTTAANFSIPEETRKEFCHTISQVANDQFKRNALKHVCNVKYAEFTKQLGKLRIAKEILTSLELDAENPVYEETPEKDPRVVIWQFLNWLFHYNPDEHVRSSYVPNPKDPERVPLGNTERGCGVYDEFVAHIPPADTFHRWKFYEDANFEALQSATRDIHGVKPDIEFAVAPFGSFASEDEANAFKNKFRNDLITDLYILYGGKWSIMGSYSQNRERVDFYNKNTAIIENMLKQIEEDKKLGADLMRKRVKKEKRKNIKNVGPDDPGLIEHKKNQTNILNSGAEDMSAKPGEEFDDTPSDAINVDVVTFRNGGRSVEKTRFYSQADTPGVTADKAKTALTSQLEAGPLPIKTNIKQLEPEASIDGVPLSQYVKGKQNKGKHRQVFEFEGDKS